MDIGPLAVILFSHFAFRLPIDKPSFRGLLLSFSFFFSPFFVSSFRALLDLLEFMSHL
jgi:hypothetical protein